MSTPQNDTQNGTMEKNGNMASSNTNPVATVVTEIKPAKLTLAEARTRLDGKKAGKRFWQSIDELAEAPGFMEMVQEEFPRQTSELTDGFSRRSFMKVMGASLALAGVTGCTKQPDEQIYPYIKQPQDLIISKPNFFATAYPFSTGAVPVLIRSREYRPVKIEGNPEHPMSKGKTDLFTQATLLDLYDPDRSKHVIERKMGQSINSDFSGFQTAFTEQIEKMPGGNGLVFLTETITSPTLAAQWKAVQAKYPGAKLVQWEPVNRDNVRIASKAAFGQYVDAQYKLENADVILSLGADFLQSNAFPGFLPLSAGYAERHRYEPGKTMNRMYVVESMPTVTGAKADHRLALKPTDMTRFAGAIAGGGSYAGNEETDKFLRATLADLKRAGSRAVVIPGEQASPEVHAAAYALNAQLGAIGSTVVYTQPVAEIPTEQTADLRNLVNAMAAGQVKVLVILGGNPIYSTPADLHFGEAATHVPFTAHLGQHTDETGVLTTWHINQAHYLESWSDARAYDGSISIVQPMIDPLYGGVTAHEVMQTLLDNPGLSAFEIVQANSKTYLKGDAEAGWRKALHDGWVQGTAFEASSLRPSAASIAASSAQANNGGMEVVFRADSGVYDGRYANNGWLQETPRQITHLSWDNAALMSMETMAALKLDETELVELEVNGFKLRVAPLMVPGHADGVVTVTFGQGRWYGRNAQFVGSNVYKIQSVASPYFASGLKISKTGEKHDLCVTSVHSMDTRGKMAQSDLAHPNTSGSESLPGHEAMERGVIRTAPIAEVKKTPGYAHEGSPLRETPDHEESFFPNAWTYTHQDRANGSIQNAWGMAIDLNSCTGCNACVVSCYAENNIPVIGREQVKIGRNMQWIRVDTYFEGDLHAPKAHFQPMMCQHCENAGCEQVCPVGATVHTPEGLNTMVYNRCVGTRYCSNNCPYKVRRFNFLLYQDYETESLKFMRNPEVTVRSRGVMEKCTYCIQRIEYAKIEADKEARPVRDGEILTACQEVCPTEAISFGNINDRTSRVAKLKAEERSYQVLADLNFRPRTSYIAGVSNPNPELETV